jgi:DNA-binding PadR family transcriptional regulator
MTNRPPRRSPLAMAVLVILAQQPMHPYGLRQRIREWGKADVINVTQRNAIYQIMERLERSGLIAVRETSRNERRPERTIYETTEAGDAISRRWLTEMLSTPTHEYPEFPAALAFFAIVPEDERLRILEERVKMLEQDIARMTAEAANPPPGTAAATCGVRRVYQVEMEYVHAMWQAELKWVRTLVDDLRAGRVY